MSKPETMTLAELFAADRKIAFMMSAHVDDEGFRRQLIAERRAVRDELDRRAGFAPTATS